MDPSFWHQKWERNEIAFHEREANPLLVRHFEQLALNPGDRVFLPLCGKTRDIAWLLSNGCRVAGAELSELAITQLFAELGVNPRISAAGELRRYSADRVDIFAGDLFSLSQDVLGPIDAIYDRGALVALPDSVRARYAAHLMAITGAAQQLLIAYEYDQSVAAGPPFSIESAELDRHYAASYRRTQLETAHVPGGLRGKWPASERVWLLKH